MIKEIISFVIRCYALGFLIYFSVAIVSAVLRKRKANAPDRMARRAEKQARKQARRSAPSAPVAKIRQPEKPLTVWDVCEDMLRQSHLLVGGTTGAGKSTLAHSIIYTLCAHHPLSASFYGIDLKRVELIRWKKTPHCKGIATDPETALEIIETVNQIVDRRLDSMVAQGLNDYPGSDIYLIVDELAELLSVNRKAVVDGLSRIMRLGRAAHVHVIGFTQAPNRSKGGGLDPLLCQNFTAAVALRCRSAIESRQIIGISGAESLPKYGEGIYWSGDGSRHIEIPKTSDNELNERAVAWIA